MVTFLKWWSRIIGGLCFLFALILFAGTPEMNSIGWILFVVAMGVLAFASVFK